MLTLIRGRGNILNMDKKYTDLQLQLWLTRQLPEEIEEGIGYGFFWIVKSSQFPGPRVTPREWDYIVRKVEEKLTNEDLYLYTSYLCEGAEDYTSAFRLQFLASWQTRTIALSKTLNIPIE